MAKLTEDSIDWLEPTPIPKELQAAIDETNRKIRECFSVGKEVEAQLRPAGRAALTEGKDE